MLLTLGEIPELAFVAVTSNPALSLLCSSMRTTRTTKMILKITQKMISQEVLGHGGDVSAGSRNVRSALAPTPCREPAVTTATMMIIVEIRSVARQKLRQLEL